MLIFECSWRPTWVPCYEKPKPHTEDLEDEMCCVEIEAREPGGTRCEGKEAALEVAPAPRDNRRFRIPEFPNHTVVAKWNCCFMSLCFKSICCATIDKQRPTKQKVLSARVLTHLSSSEALSSSFRAEAPLLRSSFTRAIPNSGRIEANSFSPHSPVQAIGSSLNSLQSIHSLISVVSELKTPSLSHPGVWVPPAFSARISPGGGYEVLWVWDVGISTSEKSWLGRHKIARGCWAISAGKGWGKERGIKNHSVDMASENSAYTIK